MTADKTWKGSPRSIEFVCLVGVLVGCGTTSYERRVGRVAVVQGRVFIEVNRVEHYTTQQGGGPTLIPELRVPEKTSDEVRGVEQLAIMEIDLLTGRCTRIREPFPTKVARDTAKDPRILRENRSFVAVPYGVEEHALDSSLIATHSPFELVSPELKGTWEQPVAWPIGVEMEGVTLSQTSTGVALEGSHHQQSWRVDLESNAMPIQRAAWLAIGNGFAVHLGSGALVRLPGRGAKIARLKWTDDWLFVIDRPGQPWNGVEGPYYTANERLEHLQRYRFDLPLLGVDRTTFVFGHPRKNGLLTFDVSTKAWRLIEYTCFPPNY